MASPLQSYDVVAAMIFKVTMNQDSIRKFTVTQPCTWDALATAVSEAFGVTKNFRLTYLDDENDTISISTDRELKDIIDTFPKMPLFTLAGWSAKPMAIKINDNTKEILGVIAPPDIQLRGLSAYDLLRMEKDNQIDQSLNKQRQGHEAYKNTFKTDTYPEATTPTKPLSKSIENTMNLNPLILPPGCKVVSTRLSWLTKEEDPKVAELMSRLSEMGYDAISSLSAKTLLQKSDNDVFDAIWEYTKIGGQTNADGFILTASQYLKEAIVFAKRHHSGPVPGVKFFADYFSGFDVDVNSEFKLKEPKRFSSDSDAMDAAVGLTYCLGLAVERNKKGYNLFPAPGVILEQIQKIDPDRFNNIMKNPSNMARFFANYFLREVVHPPSDSRKYVPTHQQWMDFLGVNGQDFYESVKPGALYDYRPFSMKM